MTDGDKKRTLPWVKQLRVRYAYGYDKSHWAYRMGIRAYPFAVLVSPAGIVKWAGPSSELTAKRLEEHLPKTVIEPIFEWPGVLDEAKAKILAGDFVAARAMAQVLDAKVREKAARDAAKHDETEGAKSNDAKLTTTKWTDAVDAQARLRLDAIDEMIAAHNYYDAWNLLHAVIEKLDGPRALLARADKLLETLDADPKVKEGWTAQQTVRGVWTRPVTDRKTAEAVITELVAMKSTPKTMAARENAFWRNYMKRLIDDGAVK